MYKNKPNFLSNKQKIQKTYLKIIPMCDEHHAVVFLIGVSFGHVDQLQLEQYRLYWRL